ncbi:hypothetical protein BKA70DRAFT_1330052 [Coprinopsis sp. MPI-PUGE-AT-0042]|nr:hypothetical protein BKA70DRAFT_1330052 [Coprinopsis sp. MPI-PUGE-AT-0042]
MRSLRYSPNRRNTHDRPCSSCHGPHRRSMRLRIPRTSPIHLLLLRRQSGDPLLKLCSLNLRGSRTSWNSFLSLMLLLLLLPVVRRIILMILLHHLQVLLSRYPSRLGLLTLLRWHLRLLRLLLDLQLSLRRSLDRRVHVLSRRGLTSLLSRLELRLRRSKLLVLHLQCS